MPLITRQSSTRGLPRVSVGRYARMRANCGSDSQKYSRTHYSFLPETGNHKPLKLTTILWVQTLTNAGFPIATVT